MLNCETGGKCAYSAIVHENKYLNTNIYLINKNE